MLEALGRLCRGPDGEQLIALLRQHAPTWLVQMPALLNAAELEALQRQDAGATRERMLRELAEALEAITAERPLVLRLEDLHWSDVSTLELLSVLARRQEDSPAAGAWHVSPGGNVGERASACGGEAGIAAPRAM